MKFITTGLIIKEQSLGERDKLVTALTESHGVVKGFAKGAKDIKSSKCAACELLAYSRLTLHKSGDAYIIGDAKPIRIFTGIRKSIEAMYTAQYLCELAMTLCPKEQESEEQLKLILNALFLLSEGKREPLLVKACVEMRLMCLSGYMPDLTMCRGCGEYEKENMCFLPSVGALECRDCLSDKEDNAHSIGLDLTVLKALRHCCYADKDKLFSFSLPEKDLRLLNFCCEEYIRFIIGKPFKTLTYLKDIFT